MADRRRSASEGKAAPSGSSGAGLRGIPGVGSATARALASAGVDSPEALLWWLPFRYEDRRNPVPLKDVLPGRPVAALVRIQDIRARRSFRRGIQVTEALVTDGTASLHVVWFNRPWLAAGLSREDEVFLYGPVGLHPAGRGLRLQFDNPEVEKAPTGGDTAIHTGRIVPVYPKAGTLGSKALRGLIYRYLQKAPPVEEVLPTQILDDLDLPSRDDALRAVHCPPPEADASEFGRRDTPGHRRLILEELLGFQWTLIAARRAREGTLGVAVPRAPETGRLLRRVLPFRLTAAQRRALREIVDDLASPKPMYRLLHGDVGSGKTVVAFLAMIMAADQGYQAAIMAPTEILASQQYRSLEAMVEGTALKVGFLTAAVKGKVRKSVVEGLASGAIPLAVGTHSLFQEKVEYHRLGLAVIDEQHRFGVAQRARLVAKGENPNVLVMSATPIPRSLALTLYGDLDLSVLDELPPGRQGVRTVVRDGEARTGMEAFLREEMDAGRQVFVVYPLVEASEESDVQAAVQAFERLRLGPFRGYEVGLLHGRMKAAAKEAVMERVRSGQTKMLVATTVVEVGVDLPQASVMVVENAERFGLAQLHQLRGRVGRGGDRGTCVLVHSDGAPPESVERLRVLEKTTDGFAVAEADLSMRGPGEFSGTRQWGGAEFRVANPFRDHQMLKTARRWAERLAEPRFPWLPGERERFIAWADTFGGSSGTYARIG